MNEQIFHKVDARDIQSVTNALIKLILGDYSDIINAEKIASLLISHNNEEFELLVENLPCDNKVKRELLDSRKLVEELNPDNNSTFENEIDEIINDVDICEGVKDLLELENGSSIEDKEEAIRKSGIKYVKRRIQHYLIDSKISSRVSVEYSLLSSTLDPENPDKLQCCSFVIGDEDFVSAIDDYYTSCIDYTADEKTGKGLSIYQHPHFLYNIPILNTPSSYMPCIDDDTITDVYLNGKGLTITNKKCRILNKNTQGSKYEIKNKNGGNYIRCGGYAIEAFSLRRPFKEMLLGAKQKSDEETRGYKLVSCDPLEDVQNTLHSFCHKNITCSPSRARIGEEKYSVYVSFPIYGSRASNQLPQYEIENIDGPTALQGIGACFIYFEPNNDIVNTQSYVQLIRLVIDKISYEVSKFIRFVSANYMFNLGLQLQENARKEAIKSAVSAIMSRNMSHNLGSHYMYYTKAYLEQLANSVGNIAPDIRGAAKVMGYVQARMDYLATVISNDKYPYGSVNFKSQIYDELTIDDFSHRHFLDEKDKPKRITNFLLKNLVFSENLTRQDVRSDEELESKGNQLFLHVKLLGEDNKYSNFTGTWHSSKLDWVDEKLESCPTLPTIKAEEGVKNRLSSLNIALPGGAMSCHALFNVIENFIRNSAKYLQNDINKKEGLICTLAISPNPQNDKYVDITIYDNKLNANKVIDKEKGTTLYQQILEKLSMIVVIDDHNKISKENKGFKEMLFSAIWMRAYTFGNDKTYADIISDINIANCGEYKISLIEKHGFSLVKVIDSSSTEVVIYKRNEECNDDCNLGLQITLPLFKECDTITLSGDKSSDVDNILNTMADIVEVDEEFLSSQYRHVFTRPLLRKDASGLTDWEKYHKVVKDRFPDIDKYALSLKKAEIHYNDTPTKYQLFFKHHLSTSGNANPEEYFDYAYADTVSGGNFTITLRDLFCNGYENGSYKTNDDKIFALKIKESALTRITIIDERLFNSTNKDEYPWLALKNIRVLNYNDSINEINLNAEEGAISDIFIGNNFRDESNDTHFLTIHLGLIEKILKNSRFVDSLINKKLGRTENSNKLDSLNPVRVKAFMGLLREQFGGNDPKKLYVAIHSGRGNYSAELEGPLSKYPFISLSALESAFNNSKFQLSELLYNTVYIGKGFANNINKKKK